MGQQVQSNFEIFHESNILGSGKTYTMVGSDKRPGLMMLLTKSLYDKINPHEFTVYLSYLVIKVYLKNTKTFF